MKNSQFNSILSLLFLLLCNQALQTGHPKMSIWFFAWSMVTLVTSLVNMRSEWKLDKATADICGSDSRSAE